MGPASRRVIHASPAKSSQTLDTGSKRATKSAAQIVVKRRTLLWIKRNVEWMNRLCVFASLLLFACSNETETSSASVSTSATTGAGGGAEPIAWQPCPLELGGTENDAECATVDLPVRWDRPDGDTIGVFVQRYLARIEPAYRQLWMLQGGPGAAGDGYAPIVRALAESDPSIDFYIPDHRGTG